MEKNKYLLIRLAKIGRARSTSLSLNQIQPFKHFFNKKGALLTKELDELDGRWTRREILARYLMLSAVLDQGPDSGGINLMLTKVINELYKQEIRIFHRPIDFFKEIGISVDNILKSHSAVKKVRAVLWAKANKSNPDKYNLFLDNSKQVLNYAIFRWGVPLVVPLLLEKDSSNLIEYLEKWPSSEIMSQQLKDHERYGLGKAIGDKAAHLFAKWYVQTFKLARKTGPSWGNLSFELPLDSNVGRVLFRTGWLSRFASLKKLKDWTVIKKGEGKGGTNHIQVTNLRGKRPKSVNKNKNMLEDNVAVCRDYLKTRVNPRSIEIQQIPNILLLDTDYGISDLDDGLMKIGTKYCLNHERPKCDKCLINDVCEGYQKSPELIKNFRT